MPPPQNIHEDFPEFTPKSDVDRAAFPKVPHSGDMPTHEGGERPDVEYDNTTLRDAVAKGLVQSTFPGRNEAQPPVAIVPEKPRFSPKAKGVALGTAVLAIAGGIGFGIALGKSSSGARKDPQIGLSPSVSNSTPNTQGSQTSSIDLNTNKAVIVAPTPKLETTPSTTAASSSDQPTTPATKETVSTAFAALEPAPNANEYPKEQQKYVINSAQLEQNPDGYLKAYGETIGAKEIPVGSAEYAQFETWLQRPEWYGLQAATFVSEKQGNNLNALANALLANPNLGPTDKKAVVTYFAGFFLFNNLESTVASDRLIPFIEDQVTKIPKGSVIDLRVGNFVPAGGITLWVTGKDAETGVPTYKYDLGPSAPGPVGYSNDGIHGFRWIFVNAK